MKTFGLVAAWLALLIASLITERASAVENEGVALAIVYDTSGSMKDPVSDRNGNPAPKYVVANRALIAIARQVQAYATNSAKGTPRTIDAGLFIFNANSARAAVKFGPFDEQALENWARTFSSPKGNTPLGNALTVASRAVLDSPLPRKHVLVITDGINTSGPQPAAVLPGLRQEAEAKKASLSVHFIAFDVDSKVFDPIKKLGATVVGAADEKQLNSQLEFILQRKILLEEEEVKPKLK